MSVGPRLVTLLVLVGANLVERNTGYGVPLKRTSAGCGAVRNSSCHTVIGQLLMPADSGGYGPNTCHLSRCNWVKPLGQICH